ncbi:MAG: hypothetical protein WCQ99_03480 [Pseudomonadota bacterium]
MQRPLVQCCKDLILGLEVMKVKHNNQTDIHGTYSTWIDEIAAADKDAHDAIPFGHLMVQKITDKT